MVGMQTFSAKMLSDLVKFAVNDNLTALSTEFYEANYRN